MTFAYCHNYSVEAVYFSSSLDFSVIGMFFVYMTWACIVGNRALHADYFTTLIRRLYYFLLLWQAYGIVWKAVDRKTGETVAVKKIFDAFRNRTDAQVHFTLLSLEIISIMHGVEFSNLIGHKALINFP